MEERPAWTYFLIPGAIILAAFLLRGNFTSLGATIAPKTGTIQYGVPEIKKWAKTVKGLDQEAFVACLDSDKYKDAVETDRQSGAALGVTGTPTFFINGTLLEPVGAQPFAIFQQAIDATIASTSATVDLVEYSDFQCPFCRSFFNETYPSIKKEYIDTGKITFSYHHYPLPFHPAAEKSAEAAECAREQGKFWELHDAIFTLQAK